MLSRRHTILTKRMDKEPHGAKFHSEDGSLDEKGDRFSLTSIDNKDLNSIIEADSAAYIRQIGKLFNVNHSTIVRHLDQISKV